MTRSQLHASLAIGSILVIAVIAAVVVPEFEPISADGRAERICRGTDTGPTAAGPDNCRDSMNHKAGGSRQ